MGYTVSACRDDHVELQGLLNDIATEGGRVISVTWQPTRDLLYPHAEAPREVESGFTVVSESFV